jgi:hypothetical protein
MRLATTAERVRLAEILRRIATSLDPNDYLEAHALLASGINLAQGLADARAIFGPQRAHAISIAKALCDVAHPDLEGKLPTRVRVDLVRAVEKFARDPGSVAGRRHRERQQIPDRAVARRAPACPE